MSEAMGLCLPHKSQGSALTAVKPCPGLMRAKIDQVQLWAGR